MAAIVDHPAFQTVGPATPAHRSRAIDALRGMAVVLVLFRHPVLAPETAGKLRPLATFLHRFGWTGVDLFFVLSGFLIGGLLLTESRRSGTVDVRRFLIRRAFKIYPGYVALIGYAIIFHIRHEHVGWGIALRAFAPNFFHVQNYIGSPQGHTWTLAVEEHFYLLLPLVVLWLARRGSLSRIPLITLLVIVGCTALRLLNLGRPFNAFTHMSPTHLRIDSLFFGVLLAHWHGARPNALKFLMARPELLILTGISLVSPFAVVDQTHPFSWTVGYGFLYTGYGCLLMGIVALSERGSSPIPFAGPITFGLAIIGFNSYSIYLWHTLFALAPVEHRLAVGWLLNWTPAWRWCAAMMTYASVATLAGIVMATVIERPMLAFRERCFPSKSKGLPPKDIR